MKQFCLFLIALIPEMSFGQRDNPLNVMTLTTQFQRIEIVRMGPGTDMLEGLKQAIFDRKIKNAVILAGIGSATDYHFHVVSDKNLPPAQEYPQASRALDLTSVQGYILNGRIHAHMTLSDENNAFGGHIESGTIALTFFILTLGILPDDLDIEKLDNYRF